MPVEGGLELGTVVGLDLLDPKGEFLEDVVCELDRGLLVQLSVDLQDPQPRAVVDGCELVVLLAHTTDGLDELDVDLNGVARSLLFVTLPALLMALIALGGGQPTEIQAAQDAPESRLADADVLVALEVHRDFERAKVVVLA